MAKIVLFQHVRCARLRRDFASGEPAPLSGSTSTPVLTTSSPTPISPSTIAHARRRRGGALTFLDHASARS